MSKNTVNFVDGLAAIHAHFQARVATQSKDPSPVSAIVVGLQLCQQGFLILNFDVRDTHERDGEWTLSLNGPRLAIPNWSKGYMQAERFGVDFVLLDGRSISLPPGSGDAAVAAVFGTTLLSIVRDAAAGGLFQTLSVRQDCQIEVLEFDWMWEWPPHVEDMGRTNLLRDLSTVALPEMPNAPEVTRMSTRLTPKQLVSALSEKSGLTASQVRDFLQAQAELACELVAQGFPVPGIGLLTELDRPARAMVMRFGPKKGETIQVPARRMLKFTIAPAVKDVVFGKTRKMADVHSLEWYALYAADDESDADAPQP